jgi:hypothetical protein
MTRNKTNLLAFTFNKGCGQIIEKRFGLHRNYLGALIRMEYITQVTGRKAFSRHQMACSGLFSQMSTKIRWLKIFCKKGILEWHQEGKAYWYSFTDYGEEIINAYREEVEKRIDACNKRILGSLVKKAK